MTRPDLPHALDRSVHIRAQQGVVFSFFMDSSRFANWWGDGSTIDPRPGGEVVIRYPGGAIARGEVQTIDAPHRIAFTFGYDSGQPIGPGSSLVTVELEVDDTGTLVHLTHEFQDSKVRDQHVPGWRYQLALFANVAASAQHQGLDATVDAFFSLWAETDPATRLQRITALCADKVTFRDAHSCLQVHGDLSAHIAASQQFMPGVMLRRNGSVRMCQGTAVVEWQIVRGDEVLGSGCNVLELQADGRMLSVIGIPA